MTASNDAMREQFEAWISKPPFEHSCDRGSDESAWPGAYKLYETELAWETWQVATKTEREACAVVAWAAGMDAHTKALGMPCDARKVGSAAAQAIRIR